MSNHTYIIKSQKTGEFVKLVAQGVHTFTQEVHEARKFAQKDKAIIMAKKLKHMGTLVVESFTAPVLEQKLSVEDRVTSIESLVLESSVLNRAPLTSITKPDTRGVINRPDKRRTLYTSETISDCSYEVTNEGLLTELEMFHNRYRKQIEDLNEKVLYYDLALCDFYHFIFIEEFTVDKWAKMFSILNKLLKDRSQIKKNISKLKIAQQSMNSRFNESYLARSFDGVDHQKYTPRTGLYNELKNL